MNESDIRRLVAISIKRAGSLRSLAREWKISPAMLSDVMTGRRGPGPKVLDHFGLKRVVIVTYQEK